MPFKDFLLIIIIILVPSWTVAYLTDKVIYVIPMLAVSTFVTAQLFQNRNKRLEEDELFMKKGKSKGKDETDFEIGKDHD
tara:strand:+ start:149 stop:388 length:240 start_codon:yes stop_codon:yes gene_type:complete